MPEGRMLKKRLPNIALRWKVIATCESKCSDCGKQGFIEPDRYGKPTVLEKEPYKKAINPYDGTFIYVHLPMEFDHIIPLSKDGKTELKNLQLLCRKCNRSKGNFNGER